MIRNFKIRNNRLTILISTFWLSSLPIGTEGSMMFGITIISFRSSSSTSFSLRKFLNTSSDHSNLFFNLFCLFSFSLAHKSTDLFGDLVSLSTESLNLLLNLCFLYQVQRQRQLTQFAVLELIADILLYNLRILSHKLNV